jgi:hypothetical protein
MLLYLLRAGDAPVRRHRAKRPASTAEHKARCPRRWSYV